MRTTKILSILALLLLLPSLALADMFIVGGRRPATAACTTVEDQSAADDADGAAIGRYVTATWIATKLVVDSSYTICGVEIDFTQTETPAGNITACIYDDNADDPNAQVGDCSSAVNESAIIAAGGTYKFSVNATVSTGTYHIVLKRNTFDGTNYFSWRAITGFCSGCSHSSNGGAWSGLNQQYYYKTYK